MVGITLTLVVDDVRSATVSVLAAWTTDPLEIPRQLPNQSSTLGPTACKSSFLGPCMERPGVLLDSKLGRLLIMNIIYRSVEMVFSLPTDAIFETGLSIDNRE